MEDIKAVPLHNYKFVDFHAAPLSLTNIKLATFRYDAQYPALLSTHDCQVARLLREAQELLLIILLRDADERATRPGSIRMFDFGSLSLSCCVQV